MGSSASKLQHKASFPSLDTFGTSKDFEPREALLSLSQHEIELITATWHTIQVENPNVCDYAYSRILEECPQVAEMFSRRNVTRQAQIFHAFIHSEVRRLERDGAEAVYNEARKLGERHMKLHNLDIEPRAWNAFSRALLEEARRCLHQESVEQRELQYLAWRNFIVPLVIAVRLAYDAER